jgi:hypothetical protein
MTASSRAGRPILISTLHDPDARVLPLLSAHGERLRLYDAVVVAATTATARSVRDALRSFGVQVAEEPPGAAGAGQRRALDEAAAGLSGPFFCCDLDRWLHWTTRFPDEIDELPDRIAAIRPAPWYVCIGRTTRAFATHPECQRLAERATNRALGHAVGRRLDATAGACWLSAEGAALVLRASIEGSKATDLEWPALVHRQDGRRLAGLRVEGLEFETATFFPREVAAAGGTSAWIRATYDRPEVWRDRLRLAADSVAALVRVLEAPVIVGDSSGAGPASSVGREGRSGSA